MHSCVPILLLAVCCASLGNGQRRRDRTRSSNGGSDSQLSASSSRTLFEEPSTSSSYESNSFFSEFDPWSDPSFADFGSVPEWGFKKTVRNPVTVKKVEPVSDDRTEAIRRIDFVEEKPERSNRRSMIGVRTKVNSYPQSNLEDRFENRFKAAMRTRSRDRRPAPPSTPSVVEQQDFRVPSSVEEANPGNLRINSMRVSSVKDMVNKADHPGDISFGLFGAGDIGAGIRSKPRESIFPSSETVENMRVTTYRPSNFLPVTTYRPKRFQNIRPNTFPTDSQFIPVQEDDVRNSFDRDQDSWGGSKPIRKNLFEEKPERKAGIRDFVDKIYKLERPIKPERWSPSPQVNERPSPVKDNFGSPYFSLDPVEFNQKEEAPPKPPSPPKRPSVFLPTLTPMDFESTPKSILSFDPDFINEKEETIENVFVPTVMSTTAADDVKISTSAARDAERRADMAYNSKKQMEETQDRQTETEEQSSVSNSGLASDSDNLRKWREELYNNPSPGEEYINNKPSKVLMNDDEPLTTPKFVIDHEFLQGRKRVSTTTYTTAKSIEEEEKKTYDNFIPTLPPADTLDNVLDENAYSATHIRSQKLVPREEKDEEILKVEEVTKNNDDDDEIVLKGTKLVSKNGNNYGKTFMGSLKPVDGGKVDYMHLTMTDITKVLPLSKLSSVLKKHGYSASDIFNKNAKALEIVGKAMKSVHRGDDNDNDRDDNENEPNRFIASTTSTPRETEIKRIDTIAEDEDPYSDLGLEFKEWSPTMNLSQDKKKNPKPSFKIPWPKRPAFNKIQIKKQNFAIDNRNEEENLKSSWGNDDTNIIEEEEEEKDFQEEEKEIKYERPQMKLSENKRQKTPKRYGWTNPKDDDEDSEENDIVQTKISIEEEIENEAKSMTFKSLVKKISPMSLSEVLSHVGFSLPDIMRGNKEAYKEVLRYHRKALDPEAFKPRPAEANTEISNEKIDIEKIKEDTESSIAEEEEVTTAQIVTTTSTKQPRTVKSAVDLFSKCKACKRLFNNMRSSTSTTTTLPLRFGERTSKDNIERTSPTNIRQLTTKQRKSRKPLPLPDPISKRKFESFSDDSDEDESESNTTSLPNLNFTLSHLNMSETDVLDKKDLNVPGIDQIFDLSNHAAKPDIIYGKKEMEEAAAATTRRTQKKVYKNTDPYFNNGVGGNRISWNSPGYGGGGYGGYGGNGGRIITDRRTTVPTKKPTTRIPITYFGGIEDELENNNPNDILNGDYNGVNYEYEYDYTDYYGPIEEVPTGVKSALIASSVVGGLAVSIFLCIFMLCLWKNMKSKLRMSGDFEQNNPGFFSGLMFKRSKKGSKKDSNGYFNKVLPIGEQHYSTTSSEEY